MIRYEEVPTTDSYSTVPTLQGIEEIGRHEAVRGRLSTFVIQRYSHRGSTSSQS